MTRRWLRSFVCIIFCSLLVICAPNPSSALQSQNYRIDEATLGAGNMNQASSNNFSAQSGFGDLGIGNSASANYQVNAGSQTSPDPVLSVAITSTVADFGVFSPSTTTTANSTFSVINYTSYGYAVQITGAPPTSGAHTLKGMTTTSISQPGIEQFGINLVANTAPKSFGANLNNGDFGFGQIGTGPSDTRYSTPNEFRYVSGDIIASAPKSSGRTDYTISYIVNVAGTTPGGKYVSNQTLIVTGTY